MVFPGGKRKVIVRGRICRMNAAVDVSEFRIARKDVRILGTVQAVAVNIEQGDIVEKEAEISLIYVKNIRDISVNANDIRTSLITNFYNMQKNKRGNPRLWHTCKWGKSMWILCRLQYPNSWTR